MTEQPKWSGKLTRKQAIALIDKITDQDDPYWGDIVEEYYDEETDTMPSVYHVFAALGVTEEEYREVSGADNLNWPA